MDKTPAFGIQDVDLLETRPCYLGFLSIDRLTLRHRLYRGGWSPVFSREIMRRHPGVGVLLYDPDLDKVLLVEQFRAGCLDNPAGPWVLELVAGLVDKDESTNEVAVREAQEEAGVAVDRLIPVCQYYNSPGGSSERLQLYCARVDASRGAGVFGLRDEHEDIRGVILARTEAEVAIRSGRINNAMTIIAIQWLSLNLDSVRRTLTSCSPALSDERAL